MGRSRNPLAQPGLGRGPEAYQIGRGSGCLPESLGFALQATQPSVHYSILPQCPLFALRHVAQQPWTTHTCLVYVLMKDAILPIYLPISLYTRTYCTNTSLMPAPRSAEHDHSERIHPLYLPPDGLPISTIIINSNSNRYH
jgi:hypothetical protein